MTIGQLIIKIMADTQQLRDGIADAQQRMKGLRDLGGQMSGLGRKFALVATLPILALGAASLNAASDLNESLSKTNVVFGQSAASIVDWSTTTAGSLGISQQAALEAVGTYGNLFQ